MSKESYSVMTDKEPLKESEIVCSFCGPGTFAQWHVVLTDGEEAFLCYRDYNALEDAELVLADRRIGEITWEEIIELRQVLNTEEYSPKEP